MKLTRLVTNINESRFMQILNIRTLLLHLAFLGVGRLVEMKGWPRIN